MIITDLFLLLTLIVFVLIVNSFFALVDEKYLYLFEEKIRLTNIQHISTKRCGRINFTDQFGIKKKILCGKKFQKELLMNVQQIAERHYDNDPK